MLKNEISIQNLKNIQNISCLTSTWVSNSLKGHPLVCNLGLQFFKGTYLATVLQSWFIGVTFFKAEICPGSHSLRGYQWSLKDSGVRVGGRIARGMSKCTKHTRFGPLLEVEMSKKCTPLWREAHFEVKMCKTPQCRTTFGS